MLDFEHGIAQFGEGTFRMTLERSFSSFDLHIRFIARVRKTENSRPRTWEDWSVECRFIHN